MPTSATWTKRLFGLTCHQPEPRMGNGKGEKTVLVNTTGHKKSQFAVVLACMADGTKLKSMVIFKQKLPKENFPPGVLIHCHLKGWMDEVGMKLWIESVAVMTLRSSEKEKPACVGLLSSSSCRLSEVSSMPNKKRHCCNSRPFNHHSSTVRNFSKQAIQGSSL